MNLIVLRAFLCSVMVLLLVTPSSAIKVGMTYTSKPLPGIRSVTINSNVAALNNRSVAWSDLESKNASKLNFGEMDNAKWPNPVSLSLTVVTSYWVMNGPLKAQLQCRPQPITKTMLQNAKSLQVNVKWETRKNQGFTNNVISCDIVINK